MIASFSIHPMIAAKSTAATASIISCCVTAWKAEESMLDPGMIDWIPAPDVFDAELSVGCK